MFESLNFEFLIEKKVPYVKMRAFAHNTTKHTRVSQNKTETYS